MVIFVGGVHTTHVRQHCMDQLGMVGIWPCHPAGHGCSCQRSLGMQKCISCLLCRHGKWDASVPVLLEPGGWWCGDSSSSLGRKEQNS